MNDEFLFVYGTLRRQRNHPVFRRMSFYCGFETEAFMQGQLFEISDYPGAVESPNSQHQVKGELYRIYDFQRLFKLLDDYEECSPRFAEPHEYQRRQISTKTLTGDSKTAWAYIYCQPTHHLRSIASGDFLQFYRLR